MICQIIASMRSPYVFYCEPLASFVGLSKDMQIIVHHIEVDAFLLDHPHHYQHYHYHYHYQHYQRIRRSLSIILIILTILAIIVIIIIIITIIIINIIKGHADHCPSH